jgi:predicted DNA binding CopG/RHH family protein
MRKNNNSATIEAETAFAADIYKDRAAINRKAQEILTGSRQITIRLSNSEIALAKQQAEAKGLKYQTYIKMLLHGALHRKTD